MGVRYGMSLLCLVGVAHRVQMFWDETSLLGSVAVSIKRATAESKLLSRTSEKHAIFFFEHHLNAWKQFSGRGDAIYRKYKNYILVGWNTEYTTRGRWLPPKFLHSSQFLSLPRVSTSQERKWKMPPVVGQFLVPSEGMSACRGLLSCLRRVVHPSRTPPEAMWCLAKKIGYPSNSSIWITTITHRRICWPGEL